MKIDTIFKAFKLGHCNEELTPFSAAEVFSFVNANQIYRGQKDINIFVEYFVEHLKRI